MKYIGKVEETRTVGGFDGCATCSKIYAVFQKDDGEIFAQDFVSGEKSEMSDTLIDEGYEKEGTNPLTKRCFFLSVRGEEAAAAMKKNIKYRNSQKNSKQNEVRI